MSAQISTYFLLTPDHFPPICPLEVEIRSVSGKILSPDSLEQVGYCVEEMYAKLRFYSECIRIARSQWIYNISCSGEKGAEAILEIVNGSKVQGNLKK